MAGGSSQVRYHQSAAPNDTRWLGFGPSSHPHMAMMKEQNAQTWTKKQKSKIYKIQFSIREETYKQ